MALQSKILFGEYLNLICTVEPVVVIPDILSKNASLNENLNLIVQKVSLQKTAILIQANVENKKLVED